MLSEQSAGRQPKKTFLVGTYNERRVFIEDDRLVYQRGEGQKYTLRWMHGTTYALVGLDRFRLRFVVEADRAVKVIGSYADGRTDESLRTSP